jgi:hypothetical protein
MIIRVIISEDKWVHGITITKKDRYSYSLGLGKSSALRAGNPAFPG